MSEGKSWKPVDPSKAFFPVELRPVYIEALDPRAAGNDLFSAGFQPLPRHQAVVDIDRGSAFAVVTEDYKLITNKAAYDLAADAMKAVFKMTDLENMQCLNVTMPRTRSFCHIDLVHSESDFEPWGKDRWTPFVRITNSYNRTRRLKYELGFCRWVCLNGLIFGSKSVEISFAHTRSLDDSLKRWEENLEEIQALESQFVSQLRNLQRYHVPSKYMLPLACKVFDVCVLKGQEIKPKRAEGLLVFRKHISSLTTQYFDEMGEHGYAALNTLTDYASRPTGVIAPEAVMDAMQHKAGDWINDFVQQIERREFSFEDYLGEFVESAEMIAEL